MSTCCVVGGGPGGLVLAYLMARAGIEVTLLESQPDFDRDFRGDSLHPATLELMDQLGLADRLLELDHFRATTFSLHTPAQTLRTADYDRIGGKFPYVALMPQARFLDFLAREAAAYPGFTLRTGAKVTGLTEEDGRVVGVRCGGESVRADLVIAADGRFSRMRRLADLPVTSLGGGGDILWFRLPRRADDPPEADVDIYFGAGHYVGLLGGPDTWQVGYTIPKGGFPDARRAGVEPIREFLRATVPWLADRADLLTSFEQITLLSVDIARAKRWHRPGLLMIGDAAHVISPVGGNGILMAIQDAVVAANVLIPRLRAGAVPEEALAEVQRLREPAIEKVQAQQVRVEERTAKALATGLPYRPPLVFRLLCALAPFRRAAARSNAYGPLRPTLNPAVLDL
ncbi:FAD-dependent oxidoreductase [Allokutzneria albata]|uniref:2-polyprenyl-6-methoxyphenol hydroxylase n=1 Tax=Allokutzneria albata TaxID=211114 RepID=A0A1G9TQC5_ALLAB|nr:FAD-dependent oxidoreductase [Allokutzneria albata]SDM49957.1 2-polyprenyl-6-methoxyphenol hydroxylase [Allokutzneria albata]